MDGIVFILLIILILILIIGIPIGLSYFINRILKKKGVHPKWRVLSLIPIFIVGYLIFEAFYPSESFYEDDFKEVTGIDFPKNAEFEYKTASFPDHFGDYTSVSLIKVENEFYAELPNKLLKRGLSENIEKVGSAEMDKVKSKLNGRIIEKEYALEESGEIYYYVGFLSDKETLIIERISW